MGDVGTNEERDDPNRESSGPPGPGWWQASNGRWYPPAFQRTGAETPAPGPPPVPPSVYGTCPNGHPVPEEATACPQCGARPPGPAAAPPTAGAEAAGPPPYRPPGANHRPRVRILVVAFVVVAVIVLVVVGLTGSSRVTLKVNETILDESCATPYGDGVAQGGSVIVDNGNGKQLASGTLGPGQSSTGSDGNPACTYTAAVTVPTDVTTYSITVGTLDPVTVSRAQLQSYKWVITLSPDAGGSAKF